MLNAGPIRCQQTKDQCPGDTDVMAARSGAEVFEQTGPVEIIGCLSCGGCPGKKALMRARLFVRKALILSLLPRA